jgi:hypothetical protein
VGGRRSAPVSQNPKIPRSPRPLQPRGCRVFYLDPGLAFDGGNLETHPKNGQRKAKVEYIFISDAKDHSGFLKRNPAESVDPEPADISKQA